MCRDDLPLGRTSSGELVPASEVLERLQRAMPLSAVVLFGSRARGDYTQHSDFDLAVVSPGFSEEEPMFSRVGVLMDAIDPIRGVDLVGLTPGELLELEGLLVLEIVADGLPLLDDGCFAQARSELQRMLEEGSAERLSSGWRRANLGSELDL